MIVDDFNNFIKYCEVGKRLDRKSIKAYTIDINQFIQFTQIERIFYLHDIKREHLKKYCLLLSEKYSAKTCKRKIACLKAAFNYFEYDDVIEINPFRKIRIKLQEPFTLPKTITINEIERIFNLLYHEKNLVVDIKSYTYFAAIRNIVSLELLFSTGIRVAELCSLKYDDVMIHEQFIKVHGKGNRELIIYIGNNEVIKLLNEYKNLVKVNKYFFLNRFGKVLSEQSIRYLIKRACSLTGIDREITPHMFRHTFATQLLDDGVELKYIQKLLGHSSVTTTEIYTHVSISKQKDILIRHSPRNKFSFQ